MVDDGDRAPAPPPPAPAGQDESIIPSWWFLLDRQDSHSKLSPIRMFSCLCAVMLVVGSWARKSKNVQAVW